MVQSPEAVYDCLAIAKNLEEIFNGVTHQEIQRLSFLACIISLFAQRPTSEWGYTFSHTNHGTPFSSSLSFAMESLVASGILKVQEDIMWHGRRSRVESPKYIWQRSIRMNRGS